MEITKTLLINAACLLIPPVVVVLLLRHFFPREIRWSAGVVALVDLVVFWTDISYYESVWLTLFFVALKFPVFDREQMEQWLPEENLEQGSVDYEELAANNGVIVTDSEDHLLSMFYGYTPAVGDVLTFESMDGKAIEVTVMGIAKPSVTSGTGAWGLFTLTEELADQLYPDIENREVVWNVHTSEDSDALRASIFSLLENPVLTVFSRADHAASLESQLKMMTRGVYLLLAFLFVFSMVNLVNTLMTNLLARQQELGILQSVGMTGKQVSRMLIAECLWYAGVTVFLSVGIGGILGWIFDYVISSFNIFGELSYQFPLMETVVFVLALLVVTGIFSVVAVRYSKRLSLVERISLTDIDADFQQIKAGRSKSQGHCEVFPENGKSRHPHGKEGLDRGRRCL